MKDVVSVFIDVFDPDLLVRVTPQMSSQNIIVCDIAVIKAGSIFVLLSSTFLFSC